MTQSVGVSPAPLIGPNAAVAPKESRDGFVLIVRPLVAAAAVLLPPDFLSIQNVNFDQVLKIRPEEPGQSFSIENCF